MSLGTRKRKDVLAKRHVAERQKLIQLRKEGLSLLPMLKIPNFNSWPKAFQDSFLTTRLPEPTVIVHPSAKGTQDIGHILKNIEECLNMKSFSNDGEPCLTPREFLSVIYGMHLAAYRFPVNPNKRQLVDDATHACAWMVAFIKYAGPLVIGQLMNALYASTGQYCKMHSRMYWFTVKTSADKQFTITVGSEVCPTKVLSFTDGSSTVYRVGWGDGKDHLEYLELDAKLLNGPDGIKYPLYAHRHVFHRLEQRLEVLHEASAYYMWNSLKNPVYAGKGVGELHLFEYRYSNIKLGYLGVEIIDGAAIVKTFYFLTMRGMKERKMLVDKLKVSGDELEWHGLDNLSSFVNTDLFDDPNIAQCLRECGCGELERFRSELRIAGGSDLRKKAEYLKQYLKFDAQPTTFDAIALEDSVSSRAFENASMEQGEFSPQVPPKE